jgi:hypothetical protein
MRAPDRRLAAGLAGLAGGAALTILAVWAATSNVLPRIVPPGAASWALLGLALLFSLAELPLMVFALRRMAGHVPQRLLVLTMAVFVFFAAFYAAPFTLLTGLVLPGVALAGLCLVRLACVLIFVPEQPE